MSEKLSRNQEALEISQAEAEKNLEKIRRSLETESSKAEKVANRENDYSSRAHELAKQSNEYTPPKERTSQPVNLQKQKNEYFAQTMQSTRKQLTQSQRLFSNVVHTKAIERTSEIIGTTVARPSALLGAFSFSAVGSVLIYIISRKNGYLIDSYYYIYVLLAIGATAGLLIDLLRFLVNKYIRKTS